MGHNSHTHTVQNIMYFCYFFNFIILHLVEKILGSKSIWKCQQRRYQVRTSFGAIDGRECMVL